MDFAHLRLVFTEVKERYIFLSQIFKRVSIYACTRWVHLLLGYEYWVANHITIDMLLQLVLIFLILILNTVLNMDVLELHRSNDGTRKL